MRALALVTTISIAILTGCASSPEKYDPTKEARIRVFHNVGVYMHPNKTCFSEDKVDAIHASAGGFSMMVPNHKIGMPPSEGMGRSYHEYVIQPGEPLTMEMEYAAQMTQPGLRTTNRCGPVGATFIPQAGRDYEASMIFKGGYCKVGVSELQPVQGGLAKPVPIDLVPAMKCQ